MAGTNITQEEWQQAQAAFALWWESEETQKSFIASQATESNIASAAFDRGFEFAKDQHA